MFCSFTFKYLIVFHLHRTESTTVCYNDRRSFKSKTGEVNEDVDEVVYIGYRTESTLSEKTIRITK